MSVLVRPNAHFSEVGLYTAAAATAVCSAIDACCNIRCEIKWPNDILYRGKKAGGILTEAGIAENGVLAYMVTGIGLNLYAPKGGFSPELAQAGALLEQADDNALRERIIAEILMGLHRLFSALPDRSFLKEYTRRSAVLGKEITVINGDSRRTATAFGIGDLAQLCVRYPDGSGEELTYGEVSIRENQCSHI